MAIAVGVGVAISRRRQDSETYRYEGIPRADLDEIEAYWDEPAKSPRKSGKERSDSGVRLQRESKENNEFLLDTTFSDSDGEGFSSDLGSGKLEEGLGLEDDLELR